MQMLRNLAAVERMGEGIAVDEFGGVQDAAKDLEKWAAALKEEDVVQFGLDPAMDAKWDALLSAQQESARSIRKAAEDEDARGVLLGIQLLHQNACLACHTTFREPFGRKAPSTMFMTSFLSSWREMQRGLALADYSLIARQAREMQSLARVMSWDAVIESTFDIPEPQERKAFRKIVNGLAVSASRIERAATEEDAGAVLDSIRKSWEDGCIACHEQFR
ncbi:MAG: hypothetical protein JRG95_16280 [Deltaproteobacteria bacterium]|nr:hypothetical protein [Deltaproteobacteria bacterium]